MSHPSEPTGSFANVPGSSERPPEPETLPPAAPPESETLPPADPNATVAPAGTPAGVADAGDENAATQPEAGERFSLPGYQILGKLGQGGMGVVYRAKHLKLGRVVALKMVLHADHAEQDELVRFLKEAEAIAQLHHLNIVQLYDSGQHDSLPYFTLEFVPGGSLADKLRAHPLSPKDAAKLVQGIARGVQHAHERGIIHRDLKPANVLLAEDGTPKVTDFGLARRVDAAGLTATGAVMGTPSYMAPEQAGGETKKIGAAADVYALGAILYECLTGRPPFRGTTPLDTMLQVLSAEPVAVRTLQGNVPRDLETICLKCLEKEPQRRYASAEALAQDLDRFLEGDPVSARALGEWELSVRWAKKRPMIAALTGLTMIGMLLIQLFLTVTFLRGFGPGGFPYAGWPAGFLSTMAILVRPRRRVVVAVVLFLLLTLGVPCIVKMSLVLANRARLYDRELIAAADILFWVLAFAVSGILTAVYGGMSRWIARRHEADMLTVFWGGVVGMMCLPWFSGILLLLLGMPVFGSDLTTGLVMLLVMFILSQVGFLLGGMFVARLRAA